MTEMLSMILAAPGQMLRPEKRSIAEPGPDQLLIRVSACGVCRTDLHIVDGELPQARFPLIPGHEVAGRIVKTGARVHDFSVGERVGVPWLGRTCGHCLYCRSGRENLCDSPDFTGCTVDGGYAEYIIADRRYCFALPAVYGDAEAAPLLCAGLIGQRSLSMAGDAEYLGLFGFGAAAHIIAQVARYEGRRVYAFTRPGDTEGQSFAREIGAEWAGDSESKPSHVLDAAIIFAPVGALVPAALRTVRKGGTVVCAGIHMSDIPAFPYEILWGERSIRSVANLTREDGEHFLALAPKVPVKTTVKTYPLIAANEALHDLRCGRVHGAAVLIME